MTPLASSGSPRSTEPSPEQHDDVIVVPVPDAATARAMLAEHGDSVRDFEFRHGRMDDVFLALTGRSGDGPETGTEDAA